MDRKPGVPHVACWPCQHCPCPAGDTWLHLQPPSLPCSGEHRWKPLPSLLVAAFSHSFPCCEAPALFPHQSGCARQEVEPSPEPDLHVVLQLSQPAQCPGWPSSAVPWCPRSALSTWWQALSCWWIWGRVSGGCQGIPGVQQMLLGGS